jgi:hypothetical protein
MFTIRNTVMLAIMQIGVIVAGVLGAGLCHKAWISMGVVMPQPVALLYQFGIAGFLIPLAWSAFALILFHCPKMPDETKDSLFAFGILVLIALAVFVLYADVTPWLNISWGLSGDQ